VRAQGFDVGLRISRQTRIGLLWRRSVRGFPIPCETLISEIVRSRAISAIMAALSVRPLNDHANLLTDFHHRPVKSRHLALEPRPAGNHAFARNGIAKI